MLGICYLDLWVVYRDEDKYIWILYGFYGWIVEEILEEVNRFVVNFFKEIVIFDFNYFYNMDLVVYERLVDILFVLFSEIFCVFGKDGLNVIF